MGFINQMLKQYCPQGVEFRKLSEVFTRYKGTSITASKMHEISKENGTIRVFAGGKTVIDTDIDSLPNGNIIDFPAVLVQSRGIIDVIYYDKPFTFKNEMWAYSNKNKIKTKFLYYYLKHNIKHFRKLASSMGALPQIGIQVTDNYLIPVPPIEIQTEIVRILDVFNDLEAELEAELEARKKQYEFYRDQLLSFAPPQSVISNRLEHSITCELRSLGELLVIKNGRDYKHLNKGHVPVYGSGGIIAYVDEYAYDLPSVLIPRKGSLGNLFYVDKPFWTVDTCFYTQIGPMVIPKYVFYCLQKEHLEKLNNAGGVPSLTQAILNKVTIPVPPIAEQERIIALLDRFDKLINDISEGLPAEIEARRKQYEYYRDKLLTFKPIES